LINGQAEGGHLHGGELDRNGVEIVGPEEVECEKGDESVPKTFDEPEKTLHRR